MNHVIGLQDANVLEVLCDRCCGCGFDPVRVGMPGETPCDPEWCLACGGAGSDIVDLSLLFTNLAIAAGLCEAFYLGYHKCAANHPEADPWFPGCGRCAR